MPRSCRCSRSRAADPLTAAGRSRAVLFDVFGTLVEYQPDRAQLAAARSFELARSYGYGGDHREFVAVWDAASHELEAESRRTLVEFSMTDAAIAFADDAALDLTPEQHERLGRVYVEEWSEHVRPIVGVGPMLERLSATWAIAIVSNTHDTAMVPRLLDEMGATSSVAATVLSVEHGRVKPHASIYESALARLGVDAGDAVFVGDSLDADYLGPRALGLRALLIDPERRHDVDVVADLDRIASVLDVERVLAALDASKP